MARLAPKTFLDDELIRDFCEIVTKGNFRLTACQRLGLSYSTFGGWIKKGRNEIASFKEGDEPSVYAHFVIALEGCESIMEQSLVQDVVSGDNKDKIWFLKHRWNKKYTANPNVVLDDDEAELVRVDPVDILLGRLQELKARMDSGE